MLEDDTGGDQGRRFLVIKKEIELKTYKKILQELSSNSPNHLLLGNGFNNSLGIETDYKSIFEKMKEKYPDYSKVEDALEKDGYDIEALIKNLKRKVKEDEKSLPQHIVKEVREYKKFLPQYIARNVKLDFMQAANSIVKTKINKVYQEENQRIHVLFRKFTNYFTLNYDPFLYLLLMKFKKHDEHNIVMFQKTTLFQAEDLDRTQNDIYSEVKKINKDGVVSITNDGNETEIKLQKCTKTEFTKIVQIYFKDRRWDKDRGWNNEAIQKAVDLLWDEKNQKLSLVVNDGFRGEEFSLENQKIQNLFFLHGAFHIYRDKKLVKKVTQSQDKALYERLGEIIDSKEKDLVCVFAGTSEEKKEDIEKNKYLKVCLEKLSSLTGCLVILGSSLSDNDRHIFEAINKSSISSIYISSTKEDEIKRSEESRKLFPDKEITLFNSTTISYSYETD